MKKIESSFSFLFFLPNVSFRFKKNSCSGAIRQLFRRNLKNSSNLLHCRKMSVLNRVYGVKRGQEKSLRIYFYLSGDREGVGGESRRRRNKTGWSAAEIKRRRGGRSRETKERSDFNSEFRSGTECRFKLRFI